MLRRFPGPQRVEQLQSGECGGPARKHMFCALSNVSGSSVIHMLTCMLSQLGTVKEEQVGVDKKLKIKNPSSLFGIVIQRYPSVLYLCQGLAARRPLCPPEVQGIQVNEGYQYYGVQRYRCQ